METKIMLFFSVKDNHIITLFMMKNLGDAKWDRKGLNLLKISVSE